MRRRSTKKKGSCIFPLLILGVVILALSGIGCCWVLVMGGMTSDSTIGERTAGAITPSSICTKPRFGKYLGPDELISEGTTFKKVSEVSVRFDCRGITSEDRISFKWYRNGTYHRTNTYQSDAYDQSSLISWRTLPGKYLITLFSRHGYLGDLEPGEYRLIVYVDGKEAVSGTIKIE